MTQILFNRKQLAEALSIGITTLEEWRKKGVLPPPVDWLPGDPRWSVKTIEDWINSNNGNVRPERKKPGRKRLGVGSE